MSDYISVVTATRMQKEAFQKAVDEEVSTEKGFTDEGCEIMKKFIKDYHIETWSGLDDSMRKEVFCAGLLQAQDSDQMGTMHGEILDKCKSQEEALKQAIVQSASQVKEADSDSKSSVDVKVVEDEKNGDQDFRAKE